MGLPDISEAWGFKKCKPFLRVIKLKIFQPVALVEKSGPKAVFKDLSAKDKKSHKTKQNGIKHK